MVEGFELRDYITPLKRWWWLLLTATLVAAGSSYVYTSLQPKLYQSSTTLMVGSGAIQNLDIGAGEIFQTETLAERYASIAKRGPVRNGALEALGLSRLPEYNVWPEPNSPFINLAVIDTNPERAQAVAQELVNQLILQSPSGRDEQSRKAFIDTQLDEIEQSIRDTDATIAEREQDLLDAFSATQIASLNQEIATLNNKIVTLRTTYAALLDQTQTGSINSIEVIEPAYVPREPMSSNALQNTLLAGMIGLVLAMGGIYVLEYLDDTLKSQDAVERQTKLTSLGAIPFMTEEDTAGAEEPLIMVTNAQAPAAEAYRVLRTNLQFAAVDGDVELLMVTSPSPKEGKSITTANLSAALAHAGKRVILVDADLHRPRQHQLFHLINNVGLTTALLHGDLDFDIMLRETAVPNLRVMTSGPLPPNPAELLGSARMVEVLHALKEKADIVVLDSPPVTAVADAAVLSTKTDGVLLVVRSGRTRRDFVKRTVEALQKVNARVVGTVLNGINKKSDSYHYSYGYRYGYSTYGTTMHSLPRHSRRGGKSSNPLSRKPLANGVLGTSSGLIAGNGATPHPVKDGAVVPTASQPGDAGAEGPAPDLQQAESSGETQGSSRRKFSLISNSNGSGKES